MRGSGHPKRVKNVPLTVLVGSAHDAEFALLQVDALRGERGSDFGAHVVRDAGSLDTSPTGAAAVLKSPIPARLFRARRASMAPNRAE